MRNRISVDLETRLLAAVDRAAASLNESRNAFIVRSLKAQIRTIERARVDADFGAMADDPAYQQSLRALEVEMAPASDAAWRVAESVAAYGSEPSRPRRKGKRRGAR
jgi:hypothetical protein